MKGPPKTPLVADPEVHSLKTVMRSMRTHQAKALMLVSLAETCARDFRGNECNPPRKLLLLPDGSKHRVEVEDVIALENELRRMAAAARAKLNALYDLEVPADGDLFDASVTGGPIAPPPANECAVEVPVRTGPRNV